MIVDQLEAGVQGGEFIDRMAPLLIRQFELLHDGGLAHNGIVRLVFSDPLSQFTLVRAQGECFRALLHRRDDHALEVIERRGPQQDARDDPLDVLQTAAAAGKGKAAGQLPIFAAGFVLEDLAVERQRQRARMFNPKLCQVAGQFRRLDQSESVTKKLRPVGAVDEAVADRVALPLRMNHGKHTRAPAFVLENDVGRLRRKVVLGELEVVLVGGDHLRRCFAKEQGKEAKQGSFPRGVLTS